MDTDSIGSTSSRSGSSLNETSDNSYPTTFSKESETDDEIVTELAQKHETEVEKRHSIKSTSPDEFSRQGNKWNDSSMLTEQLKKALETAKFTVDELSYQVEIKNRELKAYQQMFDIASETIETERENAIRRGSLRPVSQRLSFARRVSGLFMSTSQPNRRSLQSESLHKPPEVMRMSTPGASDVLEYEKKNFETQRRIWYSMIEAEAARNFETKKQLDEKCKQYSQLLQQFNESSAQLEICRKELISAEQKSCSLCADLTEQLNRLTRSFDENLKFESAKVEELKAALRLEREIVHDLAMAVGEKAFKAIRKRAESNHAV